MGTKSKKRDSKSLNRKRIKKNLVTKARRDEQELRETIEDLGIALRQINEHSHLIGMVIKIYQPKLDEESNRTITNPFGALALDLNTQSNKYDDLCDKVNSFYIQAPVNTDFDSKMTQFTDTMGAVNLLQEADNITNSLNTSIFPLLMDCNEQARYLIDTYGTEDFDEGARAVIDRINDKETLMKINTVKETLDV